MSDQKYIWQKNKPTLWIALWLFVVICSNGLHAEPTNSFTNLMSYQFLSYDKVPTWVGVVSDWGQSEPKIHLYDRKVYLGHADYVAKGLKTGINFQQFKKNIQNFQTRKYLPFLLFDLSQAPVEIGGKKYHWAVKIVDYDYQDTIEQKNSTTTKLLQLMEKFLSQSPRYRTKGILILSLPKHHRVIPAIQEQGFAAMTVQALVEKSEAPSFKVMNPGVGVGYLRYVPAEQVNHFSANTRDILVLEKLPYRLPPVAGIITLTPQTELAHVNLLAKNRGTFNVYTTDLVTLPEVEKNINQLVRMDCSEKACYTRQINQKEAEVFWQSKRKTGVTIEPPDLTVSRIISLGEEDHSFQKVSLVGAKAANYALIQKNFPKYVRTGFALPFKNYVEVIKKSGAQQLINYLVENKSSMTQQERHQHLKKIRESILSTQISANTLHQLRQLQQRQFGNRKLRLRSSTNCEDLPQFNGAGLYLSKSFKPTNSMKKLNEKLLEIYASLWTPLAFEEREYYQIDHQKVAMAILINESFSQEYANGVVLTIPQASGASQILINAQIGENAVTNPEAGQVPESILFESFQSQEPKIQARSNLGDVFYQKQALAPLLSKLREISIRSDELLRDRLAVKERAKYGIDIEFKVMKSEEQYQLFIKQLRLLGNSLPN